MKAKNKIFVDAARWKVSVIEEKEKHEAGAFWRRR
jgi:hypothetical protein